MRFSTNGDYAAYSYKNEKTIAILKLEKDEENPQGKKKESLFSQVKNQAGDYVKGQIKDKVSGFAQDEADKAKDGIMGMINGGNGNA